MHVEEEAGLAVLDEVGNALCLQTDDGDAGCLRFANDLSESLSTARKD